MEKIIEILCGEGSPRSHLLGKKNLKILAKAQNKDKNKIKL